MFFPCKLTSSYRPGLTRIFFLLNILRITRMGITRTFFFHLINFELPNGANSNVVFLLKILRVTSIWFFRFSMWVVMVRVTVRAVIISRETLGH